MSLKKFIIIFLALDIIIFLIVLILNHEVKGLPTIVFIRLFFVGSPIICLSYSIKTFLSQDKYRILLITFILTYILEISFLSVLSAEPSTFFQKFIFFQSNLEVVVTMILPYVVSFLITIIIDRLTQYK